MELIERNMRQLKELSEKYNVSELYVFGSIISGQFTDESDIDFLVAFNNIELNKYADNYFDFKFALENLFGRKIDLLEDKAIKNPYLKESIEASKKLIYGQRDKSLVV